MRNISDTIARLKAGLGTAGIQRPASSRLSQLDSFGANPGALRAYTYIPERLPQDAPLVVALHGCTQTAADFDHGTGWSQLADRHGFAVLFPEQQRSNNANLCFNWFAPQHVARDSGEVHSIAQMVRTMVRGHGLDPARTFVTGLSAGGAMTSAMLATYPELFAGGAIIAGLPFGCAASVPEAFDRMRGHGLPSEPELEAQVRAASGHRGPWPTLSLWHGTADKTVAPANMDAIVGQWRRLHGLPQARSEQIALGRHIRRVWSDPDGIPRIEAFHIAGMGHGTPLDGADDIGAPGAFMLDAKISSTRHIARFWQLTTAGSELALPERDENLRSPAAPGPQDDGPSAPAWRPHGSAAGVGKVIEDALRAAGLMR